MPAPNPEHLLDQADKLVALPAAGAPRQTDLRRAISNAYYAVFHTVLAQAADTFVGTSSRKTELYGLIYRSIDHGALEKLCEEIIKSTLAPKYAKYAPAGGFSADLIALASAVIDLKEKRHSADYDPLYKARTSDAVAAVASAREAITRFKSSNTLKRKIFLGLLLIPPRR